MRYPRLVSVALAVVLTSAAATQLPAQSSIGIPSYYLQNPFNLTSPVALPTPAGGFANPAVYGWLDDFSGQFGWSNNEDRLDKADQWGAFLGTERVGFGVIESQVQMEDGSLGKVQDYRVALVDHHWNTTVALAYGWSERDVEAADRSDILQVGMVHWYRDLFALGVVGNFAIDGKTRVGLFDLAVRPLGNWLTVFGDAELPSGTSARVAPWSAGALFEGIAGIQLSGRYFSDQSFNVGVSFKFYGLWLTGSPSYDQTNERTGTTYEVRF